MDEADHTFMLGNSLEEIMQSMDGHLCSLCNDQDFFTRDKLQNHVQNVHFKYRFLLDIEGQPGCVLPCRKNCFLRKSHDESNRSHFHCPFCCKKFGRSQSFKAHLTGQGKCQNPSKGQKPQITYNPDNVIPTKAVVDTSLPRKRNHSTSEKDYKRSSVLNMASNNSRRHSKRRFKQEDVENGIPQIESEQQSLSPDIHSPTTVGNIFQGTNNSLDNSTNSPNPYLSNTNNIEDSITSCEVQKQILRVLEDLLEVEKQRLEIERQKLQLNNLQATHQLLNMHK